MNFLMFIASCVVGFSFLAFAVIIYRGGLRERLNRSCFLFMVCFALWIVLNYLSNVTGMNYQTLLVINRILFVTSLVDVYLLANFVISITKQRNLPIVFHIITGLTILFSFLSLTSLIVGDITSFNTSLVGVKFGYLAISYFFVVIFIAIYIIFELILGIYKGRDQRVRLSSKTLLLTIGVAIIAILITNVFIPVVFNNFSFSTFGLLFGALGVGGVSYSVVRHGLFDVRLAVVRSVTYSLVLVTLASLYLVAAFAFSTVFNSNLTSPSQAASGVVISLLLAFVFQPIRRFFDRITNTIFYKDNYNSDDFFARLNRTLTFTTDLRGLLERAAEEIGHTLKSEQTFFFINTSDGHYVSAGTLHHQQLPKSDANQISALKDINHGVINASLSENDDPIRRLMLSHRIELVLPLTKNDEVIGYLCLGEHLTSGYTNRDMKVLNTIADELTIAIQNALAVQEIREFNETLKQRIANATKELRTSNSMLRRLDKAKDEFVSMASHQLRTPLTSVKGYISMVLDGDAGKVSVSQRQLLDEAFNSSERMVRLINDFLNVSRIQTGKFIIDKHPIDMSQLIEQEIDSLQSSALVHNMKFIYNPPKNFPMVDIDEGKIRQVVMNFADNAIYYSNDNSDININLSVDSDNIIFTIKDTGIGVPVAEQDELFTKFYRASNAKKQRPDGTGVGLYLAKKIINAHEGKVIFESAQNKGSTFGFSIPINQD